jgi:Rieske Fe-S protein
MSEVVTRRNLLVLGKTAVAAWGVGACAVIRGGARHPRLEPSQQRVDGNTLFIPLAALGGLKPGEVLEVKPGGAHPDLLVRHEDSGWQVITAHCTHRGCIVDWNASVNEWQCPCHGSRFGSDGHVLKGPAERPLQAAPVRVQGDVLVADLGGLRA